MHDNLSFTRARQIMEEALPSIWCPAAVSIDAFVLFGPTPLHPLILLDQSLAVNTPQRRVRRGLVRL